MLFICFLLREPTEKLSYVHLKRLGNIRYHFQRDISLPSLDTANVRPMASSSIGQLLLCPAMFLT